jgi:hypothetical protein
MRTSTAANQIQEPVPVLLSLPAFARKIGLSYPLVTRMVKEGQLPVRKIGNRSWIIFEEALEALRTAA